MTHEEKIKRWVEFAKRKGIPWRTARPPIDRILFALGFEIRPSFFWSYPVMALFLGTQFGIFGGTFMFFALWRDKPFLNLIVISVVAIGIPFGLFMGLFHVWYRRKWKLPSWDKFSSDQLD